MDIATLTLGAIFGASVIGLIHLRIRARFMRVATASGEALDEAASALRTQGELIIALRNTMNDQTALMTRMGEEIDRLRAQGL